MQFFNYKLEIEVFRNFSQKHLGVLRGSFLGFGCPKRHPDALLAKTMASHIDGNSYGQIHYKPLLSYACILTIGKSY